MGASQFRDLGTPRNLCQRTLAAPPDLFSDLFSTADEYVSPRAGDAELAEARSDPEIARSRFLALTSVDFPSESAIVQFLEDVYGLVNDYEVAGFGEHYSALVHNALAKFNLRYRLEGPFSLRFLLPGSFVNYQHWFASARVISTWRSYLTTLRRRLIDTHAPVMSRI